MKKTVLGILMTTLVLASCGKEPGLTFQVGGAANELAYWEEVLSGFTAETGIEVELIRQSSDTEARQQGIIMALRGGLADPDVMLMDVGWMGQIAANGWLLPLDEFEEIDSSVFFSGIVNQADIVDGELIALPVYVDGGLLYYRTDLLEKYGYSAPPKTWDELYAMSETIQAGERAEGNSEFWGFTWQGAQYEGLVCDALEYFVSFGGGFLDENGDPMINETENVEALEFMASMIGTISSPDTYSTVKEEEARLLFQQGNAAFERNWPYAYGLHAEEDSVVKDVTGIAELPSKDGESSASTLGGWHAGISAYTDMTNEAVQLLAYILSYESEKNYALNLGWNPGRTDVYTDKQVLEEMPYMAEFQSVFEGAVPRPSDEYYTEMSSVLQEKINGVLAGSLDAATALSEAQAEVKEVIADYED